MSASPRWGVVGLVIVLFTAWSWHAAKAQEPSPTPILAPDDLRSILPREVAGTTVQSYRLWPSEFARSFRDGLLEELLSSLRREPRDARMAAAFVEDEFWLLAIRVDGLAGERVADAFIPTLVATPADAGATLPPSVSITTEQVGGERVRVLSAAEPGDRPASSYTRWERWRSS